MLTMILNSIKKLFEGNDIETSSTGEPNSIVIAVGGKEYRVTITEEE